MPTIDAHLSSAHRELSSLVLEMLRRAVGGAEVTMVSTRWRRQRLLAAGAPHPAAEEVLWEAVATFGASRKLLLRALEEKLAS